MASQKKFKVSFVLGNAENVEVMKKFIITKLSDDASVVESHFKFNEDGSIETTLTFKLNKHIKTLL